VTRAWLTVVFVGIAAFLVAPLFTSGADVMTVFAAFLVAITVGGLAAAAIARSERR
jgi:uncharacterized membrane protein YjjB (DUF3815 family)